MRRDLEIDLERDLDGDRRSGDDAEDLERGERERERERVIDGDGLRGLGPGPDLDVGWADLKGDGDESGDRVLECGAETADGVAFLSWVGGGLGFRIDSRRGVKASSSRVRGSGEERASSSS